MQEPLWVREREVVQLLDLPQAIDALERGLRAEAAGQARAMAKTHVEFGAGHTLHALGAVLEAAGFVGTKSWAHTRGGATPLLVLWDAGSGALRAVVEAFALGQLRTGGMTGLATRWLSAPDADELALIGTGRQALAQVAAVAAVRPVRRVRVWSPTPDHREAFAALLAKEGFGFEIDVATSLGAAVHAASIVVTATRSRAPFLRAAHVARGAHVNAIGAITPERAELDVDLIARCDPIVTDSLPAARTLARELIDYHGNDPAAWERLDALSDWVASAQGRPEGTDVTLFKAMGSGVADLALGIRVLERASEHGLGRRLEPPERASLRLRGER